jgi:hypothetical protein
MSYYIHENFPLNINEIINALSYLIKHSKYFSLEDLLNITITNPNIEGTWANNIIKNYNESLINIPFFSDKVPNNKSLKGTNKEVFQYDNNFITYGTIKQLEHHILGNIYELLMAIKITCSSFFMWEIMRFIDHTSFGINNNIYFNNIDEFKEFHNLNPLKSQILQWQKFNSVQESFNFFKDIFSHNPKYDPFLLIHDNVFCPNALVFDLTHKDRFNCNEFYYKSINLTIKPKYFRHVFVKNHNTSSLYESYMNNNLGVYYKSQFNPIYKDIIKFLKEDVELNNQFKLTFPNGVNYLKSIKPTISFMDNKPFKYHNSEMIPLFFCFGTQDISKIKDFAKGRGLLKIIVINIVDCEETLLFIQKKSTCFSHILQY